MIDINQVTSSYKNMVLGQLKAYPDNYVERLYPNQPDYTMRIDAIKIIINWQQDNDNGFCLTFNDSFTMLKKRNHRMPQAPPCGVSEKQI